MAKSHHFWCSDGMFLKTGVLPCSGEASVPEVLALVYCDGGKSRHICKREETRAPNLVAGREQMRSKTWGLVLAKAEDNFSYIVVSIYLT